MLRPRSRRSDPHARLLRWLDDGGASVELIRIEHGVVRARRDVVPQEAVFTIPLRHLITVETARASAIGRAVAATGLELPDQTWLSLYLLEEQRATDSFWRPYLATLPRKFPHLPLFFSDRELELLRGSSALEMIRTRRANLVAEYEHLCEHVSGIDEFPLERFLLMRAITGSRAFSITVFGVETLALVPLADLVDHHPHPGTFWNFDDATASFLLGASERLPRGAAVRDTYGRKGNASLLTFYGFCLEDNPHDTAVIGGLTVTADVQAAATREMFAAFAGDDDPAKSLLDACTRALAQFPTTLEQDQALLAGRRLSRNARNAILARMSEKRVLEFFARFAGEPGAADRIAPLRRFQDREYSHARDTA